MTVLYGCILFFFIIVPFNDFVVVVKITKKTEKELVKDDKMEHETRLSKEICVRQAQKQSCSGDSNRRFLRQSTMEAAHSMFNLFRKISK